MPGIPILGDSLNAARSRPTSLPAEARSLSRILRLLKSPETASLSLVQSLAALPSLVDERQRAAVHRVQCQVSEAIKDMKEAGWSTVSDRYPEYNMAMAVESVLQDPSSFELHQKTPNGGKSTACSEMDGSSVSDSSNIIPVKSRGRNGRDMNNNLSIDDSPTTKQNTQTASPTAGRNAATVVSDNSSIEEDDESSTQEVRRVVVTGKEPVCQTETVAVDFDQRRAARHIWSLLLESIHLQVASRTTKVWGRKKIYEVYQFSKPIQDFSADQEAILRCRLESECRSLFEGVLGDASHCRVYATLQPLSGLNISRALYVQINLGKLYDLQDETNRAVSGEKKKKDAMEFIAVLIPGSAYFALTASRSPSRSRYTPYVYAVLESVLTETARAYASAKANKINAENQDVSAQRFGDLSGTEPEELLRAARTIVVGEAAGRFLHMAVKDQSNPIHDLHTAATGNLLRPADDSDDRRLDIGEDHPGSSEVAKEAAKLSTGAALVASNRNGDNLWVDHSVGEKQARKRAREKGLGGPNDCPKLQRICWKWSGETSAASSCWLGQDNDDDTINNTSMPRHEELAKTEFKCAVVMKGENVLQGVAALVEAGLMESPLPDFIRDAPSMGGVIRVDHGSFVAADASFKEV